MTYYFIRNAATDSGPFHFPVCVNDTETLHNAVERVAGVRGVVICHDWRAEPIDAAKYRWMVE